MSKRDVPGYENLEWNCGDDWAIPLPEFPVDGVFIQRRWYIPDETPDFSRHFVKMRINLK